MTKPGRIAIVGAGIAGLTAAYLLRKRHDVMLYEKTARVGGNAYTIKTRDGSSLDIAVAAFGRAGYSHFYSLLDELGVETDLCPNSYMSFHDLDSKKGLYLTPSFKGSRLQHYELLKPATIRSILNLFVGMHQAQRLANRGRLTGRTMGQCIDRIPRLSGDTRVMLLSALCLLSSMSCDEVLATPATFFLGKLRVHNDVLSPRAIYSVRAVTGGTEQYIEALRAPLAERIELNADIRQVTRSPDGVDIDFADGRRERFDHLVMACPADVALELLADPTAAERELLGVWSYKPGPVIVHRDHSSFPPRALTQAYTFLYTNRDGRLNMSVNGALWHEPQAPDTCEYVSTQHPNFPIRDDRVEFETTLFTPRFTFESCATTERLPGLNGVRRTYFCGSYFGYGLHNDAVRSAVRVANELGVDWKPKPDPGLMESGFGLVRDVARVYRRG